MFCCGQIAWTGLAAQWSLPPLGLLAGSAASQQLQLCGGEIVWVFHTSMQVKAGCSYVKDKCGCNPLRLVCRKRDLWIPGH